MVSMWSQYAMGLCSMFGVDVVVDTVGATSDTVYLMAAGNHVPGNALSYGGDAFAWQIVVPK
jgi:hypothetical protein